MASALEEQQRTAVDQVARTYIGTPLHDHGEVKGAGVNCATLLKCVATEAGIFAPADGGKPGGRLVPSKNQTGEGRRFDRKE